MDHRQSVVAERGVALQRDVAETRQQREHAYVLLLRELVVIELESPQQSCVLEAGIALRMSGMQFQSFRSQ